MTLSLIDSSRLNKVVVVDIAPGRNEETLNFEKYIDGMKEIEKSNVDSKRKADDLLKNHIPVCLG